MPSTTTSSTNRRIHSETFRSSSKNRRNTRLFQGFVKIDGPGIDISPPLQHGACACIPELAPNSIAKLFSLIR